MTGITAELETVSPKEAGQLLGVSRATVHRMIREGSLPSFVAGWRKRRIPLAAIRRLIERAMEEAGKEKAAG